MISEQLTKREIFAAIAFHALITSPHRLEERGSKIADKAALLADCLIEALDQNQESAENPS